MIEAATAQDALRVATERRPGVAFVDIGLPDHDGYAVAVALTGFDAHLVKPVTPEQILGTLDKVLKA